MAAIVKAFGFNGAGPTGASIDSADSASVRFGRDDLLVSTTSVPIPTTTGTHFSYVKWCGLDVTTLSATAISNRKVSVSATLTSGLSMFFGNATTYTLNNGTQGTAAGNYPADSASNAATPATITNITAWAAVTTTPTVYDATSTSTGSTGLNGKYCAVVAGADFTYAGGGGAASLSNLTFTYDEQ